MKNFLHKYLEERNFYSMNVFRSVPDASVRCFPGANEGYVSFLGRLLHVFEIVRKVVLRLKSMRKR